MLKIRPEKRWSLSEAPNFLLAEGLKIEFWGIQIEGAVWGKVFVHLVYTLTLPIQPSTNLANRDPRPYYLNSPTMG